MVSGVDHNLRLFVGQRAALRPFLTLGRGLWMYALAPHAPLYVLPLTDDVHDVLHAAYGTGEWLDFGARMSSPRLTTSDMAFAAGASAGSALAWLETDYRDGHGWQIAAVWIDGDLQMKPSLLEDGEQRPRPLLPVNMALRLLGVRPSSSQNAADEFTVSGLDRYRSNDDILASATPLAR